MTGRRDYAEIALRGFSHERCKRREADVPSRRSDHRRPAPRDPGWRDHRGRCGEALYRAGARLQRRRQHAGDEGRRGRGGGERDAARGRAAQVPDADGEGVHHPARSRQIQRPADRIRADGANCLRSERAAAVRHDRRDCQRRAGQRHRDAQHPRRAVGHLQGRVRQASIARGPAARRAAGLRILPPAAGRTGARRRARRAIRPQPRSQKNADVRRGVFVQGPVRHQGHALDRWRRRPLRYGLSRARPRSGRAASQQGRDHLRQGGEHRIQRPRRRSRRPQSAGQGAALDARLSAQHLGGQSVEPLRHHALGLAGLELRLGAVGQRQHGDGEPR